MPSTMAHTLELDILARLMQPDTLCFIQMRVIHASRWTLATEFPLVRPFKQGSARLSRTSVMNNPHCKTLTHSMPGFVSTPQYTPTQRAASTW
jgi:hypothetical protein